MKSTPVIAVFLFFFLLAFTSNIHARTIDATASIVNGDVILLSDIKKFQAQRKMRKEIDPFFAYFNFDPQSNKEINDYLIQEAMIVQKFPSSKSDIDEEISALQKKNNIDEDTLKGILANEGISFSDYQALLGISISKRKLIDRELRPIAVVSEDEIKNYYYTSSDISNKKKKQHLLLSYDLKQMRIPDRLLAQEIYDKIKVGEDFESVANKYLDRGVRVISLGTLREDSLAANIRESLEGLKVGESTKFLPITADSSFVIHKINAVSAPHDPIFEREKASIHNMLSRKALMRQVQLWTDREKANSTYIHITNNI